MWMIYDAVGVAIVTVVCVVVGAATIFSAI
jgi:hypothetical protein